MILDMILEQTPNNLRMRLHVNSIDPDSSDIVRYDDRTRTFYAYSRGVPENLTFDPREKINEVQLSNLNTGRSMVFKRNEFSVFHDHYLTFAKTNHLGQALYLIQLYLDEWKFHEDWRTARIKCQ